MNKKRLYPFTLMELFLCIAILSLASVVVGFSVKGMYDKHTLESSGKRITMKLRELQALALSYQTDMTFELREDEKGLSYRTTTDEPLPGFDRKWVALKDHCTFTFKAQPSTLLKVEIASSGWMTPQGVLEIKRRGANKNTPSLWIDFRTPLQITLSEQSPQEKKFSVPAYPE
jgi:hypothetical protein